MFLSYQYHCKYSYTSRDLCFLAPNKNSYNIARSIIVPLKKYVETHLMKTCKNNLIYKIKYFRKPKYLCVMITTMPHLWERNLKLNNCCLL